MTNAAHSAAEVALIKQRFLPQRWQEFKRDMRYFREAMGPDYFGTLSDHGGNATPVWLAIAHGLFAWMPASNTTPLATALLDPLLMLIAFAAIGKTFGIRPMTRWPMFFGAALGCVLLVFLAARGRRPEQGALLGLLLVPVVFAPANYYLHLVFLLPLLAEEHPRAPEPARAPEAKLRRPQALIWLFLLGMCAARISRCW